MYFSKRDHKAGFISWITGQICVEITVVGETLVSARQYLHVFPLLFNMLIYQLPIWTSLRLPALTCPHLYTPVL